MKTMKSHRTKASVTKMKKTAFPIVRTSMEMEWDSSLNSMTPTMKNCLLLAVHQTIQTPKRIREFPEILSNCKMKTFSISSRPSSKTKMITILAMTATIDKMTKVVQAVVVTRFQALRASWVTMISRKERWALSVVMQPTQTVLTRIRS